MASRVLNQFIIGMFACQSAIAAPRPDFVEGEVIVSYRQGASLEKAKASANRHSANFSHARIRTIRSAGSASFKPDSFPKAPLL